MKEVNGNEYRIGCTHCVLYESSGISLDWAHGKVKQFDDDSLVSHLLALMRNNLQYSTINVIISFRLVYHTQ